MNKKRNNQAFLLLTDKTTDSLIDSYKLIYHGSENLGDTFVLYHQKEKEVDKVDNLMDINTFVFTDSIITKRNYIPIGFSLIPGNNHLPLIDFYIKNPHYDYYWVIEDDVKFNGEWSFFFNSFTNIHDDFISSHIRTASEEPKWYWWNSLANPYKVIPFDRRIRSFNPIYRISREALNFLQEALKNFWCGHQEVIIPTLLNEGGFKIMDFGGTGKFVLPGYENKFYISNSPTEHGGLLDGTMRWRPEFETIGAEKYKLYHPVKNG